MKRPGRDESSEILRQELRLVLAWMCVIGTFVIGLQIRFGHPDMTETRLFLEFWPAYLIMAGLVFMAALLVRGGKA